MLSFYPGPSKIYNSLKKHFQEAFQKGISGINHRSQFFQDIYKNLDALLRAKLNVPSDYSIFFVSSATECWEIVSQSLVRFHASHIFNGDFGRKWFNYSRALDSASEGFEFGLDDAPDVSKFEISFTTEALCFVHCETSNSYLVNISSIEFFKKEYPQSLIVVDATSSMGGINVDFRVGDVWFASLQKCFGMPAGMAVLICSPNAINKCYLSKERIHYNSLVKIYENYKKWQTTHTPNVVYFYALMKLLEELPTIDLVEKDTYRKYTLINSYLDELNFLHLIENPIYRSPTVITLKMNAEKAHNIKTELLSNGIIIGNGYGTWADETIRIANFPAHEEEDFVYLFNLLKECMVKNSALTK
jgi:phosphoserine aminotransferase